MRLTTVVLFMVALGWMTPAAMAAGGANEPQVGEEQGPRTLAVQNRAHTMRHEFSVSLGLLPLDAFTKGLTVGGGYTLHFNDFFAWEVGQFTYSFGVDTRLQEELANLPQPVGPTPFERVKYYVTSAVMFKPIYGKLAVFNRALVYEEVYLIVGGGYGWLSITHRPIIELGIGTRIYAGKNVSFRVDFRDLMFLTSDDLHNELWLAFGIGLSFGGEGVKR